MKSLFLIAMLAMVASPALQGQGTVHFSNGDSALLRLPSGGGLPVGNIYQVELLFAPADTPEALFDSLAFRLGGAVNISPIPGRFNGGTRTAPTSTPGAVGLFQVRAWEMHYGASYAEAVAAPPINGQYALVGRSEILRVFTGDPTPQNPPSEPGNLMGAGFRGFTVKEVPEPRGSVLAVLILISSVVLGSRARTDREGRFRTTTGPRS